MQTFTVKLELLVNNSAGRHSVIIKEEYLERNKNENFEKFMITLSYYKG